MISRYQYAGRIAAVAMFYLSACGAPEYVPEQGADGTGHVAPTQQTAETNTALGASLPIANQADFIAANRGLVAQEDSLRVARSGSDKLIWDQDQYAFEKGDAPASVNPSLWRQAKLNAIHGLFEVTEGIYQLRGYDLANMTLIEGDTGWIIVDPLTVAETAKQGWAFINAELGEKPVRAVIFTHSHVDHFGGVFGIVTPQQIAEQGIRIIAPDGFAEEAVSENVMAGVAMQRRAGYMYGRRLARSERGHVDLGLGKEVPFGGHIGYAEPTETITETGQTLTLDGVEFVFQNAPGSEAPAELTFYLPKWKAFCGAEVVSRNLHNVYTLRGAKVRDALRWSDYIEEARQLFGGQADIYFGSHQWPLWGQAEVNRFLVQQRDTYKYIHDQTLRLANNGFTPKEIAEQLELPASLRQNFSNRGYYGTVRHNSKAVYQFYFGWYDANPANLNPLPPSEAGQKYVAAIGGEQALLDTAQTAYGDGEYRWAAELLNHLVFAAPENTSAKNLLAKVYDQLGYQAESGPWRDVYLSAAYELRHGLPEQGVDLSDALGMLRAMPLPKFFDSMAARLNGPDAEGKTLAVNFVFTDIGEGRHLWLENAVLHHEPLTDQAADATLNLTHELFLKMVVGTAGIRDTLLSDDLNIDGSRLDLVKFFGLFDQPDGRFAIVTPE